MLAATDAAEATLDGAAYALACGVAAVDTGCLSCHCGDDTGSIGVACALRAMARSHLYATVTSALVVLEGLFDGVGRLALALEIVWVVFLHFVSKAQIEKTG